MAMLTIRNIDESVKSRLRIRAAQNGRSMEDEVRQILKAAVEERPGESPGFVASIRSRFASLGGVDLDIPPREPVGQPPALDD